MNPLRRYENIMELLLAKQEVTVAELSERLNVTGKTIREDLAKLEDKGLLQRVHGGAILAQSDQLGILSTKEPLARHASEKADIARLALSRIEPNDVIGAGQPAFDRRHQRCPHHFGTCPQGRHPACRPRRLPRAEHAGGAGSGHLCSAAEYPQGVF
ncbi:hypothetical protein BGX30_005715, partial [Mortierella sp. GBA39]